ncbi:hypothetical protein GCM10007385_40480 [Tateyamaria omphalii]|nr:hypothetical protein GCM10007385_40480 [Tateyamaria omphalii]
MCVCHEADGYGHSLVATQAHSVIKRIMAFLWWSERGFSLSVPQGFVPGIMRLNCATGFTVQP